MALAIRPAVREDAAFLMPLVDAAGEGLPRHHWAGMAGPGQAPEAVGLARVAGDTASVSWRRAFVAERDGVPAGCLYAYRLPDRPEPMPRDMPPVFVPLQELEDEAAGTGHVHILATAPGHRRHGVGAALLRFAERERGPRGMSLIVADSNTAARAVYAAAGYAVAARRKVVHDGWQGAGRAWLLMIRA
ncbi:GNAT family N-acetyltransferase [Paracoccus sp. S-4012]|uniref:GNAT family N-acetyltransferase n=1 Tax=Paracoccus sp. S-4012 TaxID=2665648 RepID=UPI0012B09DE5|nr:GNAT family N-acetyltransferase [Paracoccus sp. S-4012]MRX51487.1 GNAT family N-acetyltransferase [Paracoccus sp. S-4012]